MDGENNGTPYFLMGCFGGKPTIFGNIHIWQCLKMLSCYNRMEKLVSTKLVYKSNQEVTSHQQKLVFTPTDPKMVRNSHVFCWGMDGGP